MMRAVYKKMGLMKYGEQSEMLQNWLNVNAPGYENLSPEEKDAIMHFSFLWSLFEAKVLNKWASVDSIARV